MKLADRLKRAWRGYGKRLKKLILCDRLGLHVYATPYAVYAGKFVSRCPRCTKFYLSKKRRREP